MTDADRKYAADRLKKISPCFCLAKWLQVTVDIVHGTNHSCHHPARHRIPPEELDRSVHALHNTRFKKGQRKLMLEGTRPAECVYCWDMEDAGAPISDRIIKSSDPWALPYLEKTAALPWDADVIPTYVEVMLDDRCNLSCAYCMADISRSIAAEMKAHGPYPVTDKGHRMPTHSQSSTEAADPELYAKAFWQWLPEVLPRLKVLRITGGEPLLSPRLSQLLDLIERNRQPELTLVINSHLSFPPNLIAKLCAKVETLLASGAIGKFELYTSVDAAGVAAEYIRHGMSYDRVIHNIREIARRLPSAQVVVMCAFNVLSLSSFEKFLDDLSGMKEESRRIVLDTAYLRNPEYLSAAIATDALKEFAARTIRARLAQFSSLSEHEISKIENALRWLEMPLQKQDLVRGRRDFLLFISEYDRRKNKTFLKAFPEYRDFYIECKRALMTSQDEPI